MLKLHLCVFLLIIALHEYITSDWRLWFLFIHEMDELKRCIQGVCENANMNCELRVCFTLEKHALPIFKEEGHTIYFEFL